MKLRRFQIATFIVTFSLLATAAYAERAASNQLLIPIVGRTPGALGSEWRTDVVIMNVSARPIEVTARITLHQSGGASLIHEVQLQPRASAVLEDVMLRTFGIETGSGLMKIESNDPTALLSARAIVYNVNGLAGHVSQVVPAVEPDRLGMEVSLPGLSGTGTSRSNVGIANPKPHAVTVELSLFSETGDRTGIRTVKVGGSSVLQINNIFRIFDVQPFENATVTILAGTPIYGYATVVRSDSGDADFIDGIFTYEGSEPVAPACGDPAPISRTRGAAPPGWLILVPPAADVAAEAAALSERHAFAVDKVFRLASAFYAEVLSEEILAALRCEPSVVAIEQNSYGYLSAR